MMPPPAAAAMESLDIKKAMAILVAMDPNKAADLLTGACTCMRAAGSRQRLHSATHFTGATHCLRMLPRPFVLAAEMGPPHAASKLVLMDADARNSIIESMAPRVAAVTLTSMGGSLTAAGEGGRPGSAEVCLRTAAVLGYACSAALPSLLTAVCALCCLCRCCRWAAGL